MNKESQRLLAVERFNSLSAGLNHDLDSITSLVAQLCEAPVALVTIIDENTQWFKAKIGTALECNEREQSFCNSTLNQTDMLEVTDALEDERFRHLPVVAGEPHIRFYAGVPIITFDGHAVGTVCVLDVKPRQLTDLQKNSLRTLAKQVLNIMELTWSLRMLSAQHEECERQKYEIEQNAIKLSAVFNSSKHLHILLGKNYEILAFNKAGGAHAINYFKAPLELGKSMLSYVGARAAKRLMTYVNTALAGINHQTEWCFELNNAPCWMDVSFTALRGQDGDIMGVAVNATDITINKLHAERVDNQNAALQRIATFQSHELRRPVASLMGIINLIKDEPAVYDNTYISMMASATAELDYKIRGIVKDAESTIYGNELMG